MRRVDSFSEYKACSVSGAIPNITCFYFLSAPLDRLRRPEPQRSRQGSETDALTAAFYCAGALRLLFMVPVRGDKQGDGGDKLGQDKDPEGKCVQCLASVHAPIGQAVPKLGVPRPISDRGRKGCGGDQQAGQDDTAAVFRRNAV